MVTLLKDLVLYLDTYIDFCHCAIINHSEINSYKFNPDLLANQEVNSPSSPTLQNHLTPQLSLWLYLWFRPLPKNTVLGFSGGKIVRFFSPLENLERGREGERGYRHFKSFNLFDIAGSVWEH